MTKSNSDDMSIRCCKKHLHEECPLLSYDSLHTRLKIIKKIVPDSYGHSDRYQTQRQELLKPNIVVLDEQLQKNMPEWTIDEGEEVDLGKSIIEWVSPGLEEKFGGSFQTGEEFGQSIRSAYHNTNSTGKRQQSWFSWVVNIIVPTSCKSDAAHSRRGQRTMMRRRRNNVAMKPNEINFGVVGQHQRPDSLLGGRGNDREGPQDKRLVKICGHLIETTTTATTEDSGEETIEGLFIIYVQDVTLLHGVSKMGINLVSTIGHDKTIFSKNEGSWLVTWKEKPKYLVLAISQYGVIDLVYPMVGDYSDNVCNEKPQSSQMPPLVENKEVAARILGKSLFEITHPDDLKRIIAALKVTLLLGRSYGSSGGGGDLSEMPTKKELDSMSIMVRKRHGRQRRSSSSKPVIKLAIQIALDRLIDWNDPEDVFARSRFVELRMCYYIPSSTSRVSNGLKKSAEEYYEEDSFEESEAIADPSPPSGVILATMRKIEGSRPWHFSSN